MLNDHYKVSVSENGEAFQFESVGPKGNVGKVVR